MSLSKNLSYTWKFYVHMVNSLPIQTKVSSLIFIRYAHIVQSLTAFVLAYLGSIINQRTVEKAPTINHKRAVSIAAVQLVLVPIQQYWYKFVDILFRSQRTYSRNQSENPIDINTIKKVIADSVLFQPFTIVLFFVITGLLGGKTFGDIKSQISNELWPTLKSEWKVRPASQLINFAYVPNNLRIFYINVFTFLWNAIVSYANQTAKLPLIQ